MRSNSERTLPMDEINDLRIQSLENSNRWGIRHQFVDRIDSRAGAIASVSPLRRPPILRVIQGGGHTEPKCFGRDLPFLVVVK
jgi:hypothetical protein